MRLVLTAAFLASLAATGAVACDHHGGGDDYYSGYERYGAPSTGRDAFFALQAERAAERDRAMESARQNFLSRFDIRTDEIPRVSAVAADKAEMKLISNADQRAQSISPDR